MILVRDVFQLQFGKAREAVALWKEGIALMTNLGMGVSSARILTDLVGAPYYTLVLETTYDSLAHFEQTVQTMMAKDEWRAWYPKVAPLAEGGHREIFTVAG